jgi:hypothetical protein
LEGHIGVIEPLIGPSAGPKANPGARREQTDHHRTRDPSAYHVDLLE